MKKTLMTLLCLALLCPSLRAGSLGGMPYLIYNSTYGLEYGLIGRLKDYLGYNESLTLAATLIENGGNVNNFTLSFPDKDFRHGKAYPLATDVQGAFGTYVSERYYGIGPKTSGSNYTIFDNRHSRVEVIFTRAYQSNLSLSAGMLFAGNSFDNIKQGAEPLTQNIQDICSKYYAGSVGLNIDNRDQSMDPHAGNMLLADFDFGLAFAGSPARYAKLTVDLRRYDTPFNKD